MNRFVLLSVLTIACAHAPRVEVVESETRAAPYTAVLSAVSSELLAAPAGQVPSRASYGAINVLNSAATRIFSTTTSLVGRNSFNVQNKGPNSIYCGWDSSVSTSTGTEIGSGTSLSIDITWNAAGTDAILWCLAATADQASPSNTRWLQVK